MGVLVVSTPNGAVTSHDREHPDNHHHEREYTLEEFERLLREFFGGVDVYGQQPSEEAWARRAVYRKTADRVDRLLGGLMKLDPLGLRRLIPKGWREAAITNGVDRIGQQLADRQMPVREDLEAFRVQSRSREAIARSVVLVAVARQPRALDTTRQTER